MSVGILNLRRNLKRGFVGGEKAPMIEIDIKMQEKVMRDILLLGLTGARMENTKTKGTRMAVMEINIKKLLRKMIGTEVKSIGMILISIAKMLTETVNVGMTSTMRMVTERIEEGRISIVKMVTEIDAGMINIGRMEKEMVVAGMTSIVKTVRETTSAGMISTGKMVIKILDVMIGTMMMLRGMINIEKMVIGTKRTNVVKTMRRKLDIGMASKEMMLIERKELKMLNTGMNDIQETGLVISLMLSM